MTRYDKIRVDTEAREIYPHKSDLKAPFAEYTSRFNRSFLTV